MPLDDRSDVLPGCLPARWRGIDFHMPDTSTMAGRRLVEYLFPGLDAAAYDDFGEAPEEISIEGILLGDDYRAQVGRLRQKMKTPGPGELIHPWLGGMTVILQEPGEVSFSDIELRLARFSMVVKVISPASRRASSRTSRSSASLVRDGVSSLVAAARALAGISAPLRAKAQERTRRLTSQAFPLFPNPANTDFTGAFSDWLSTTNTQAIVISSPIAPAAEAATLVAAAQSEANERLKTLSSGAGTLLEEVFIAPSPTDAAQILAAAALPIAHASELALYVKYNSRSHAIATRDRLAKNLAALQTLVPFKVSPAAQARYQAAASAVGYSARRLAAALHDDINEVIGRLPPVYTITLDRPTDAFLVAHHLFGDRPEEVERGYRSIVARNRPRHPAKLPAGTIEIER